MKNSYELRIKTDKSLDADTFAPFFLEAWLEFDYRLRPERFAHGEPVRYLIDSTEFEALIEEWRSPPALMFKRVSTPSELTFSIRSQGFIG